MLECFPGGYEICVLGDEMITDTRHLKRGSLVKKEPLHFKVLQLMRSAD